MQDFQKLIESYTGKDLAEKRNWYSKVAESYNRVRPRYSQQLLDQLLTLIKLDKNSTILEIGCGPGTATVSFANLGFSLVALEPSHNAYELAKKNCFEYPNVEIINTTFEEWQLEKRKFDAVLAATSFHWISREIACEKIAAALKDNGYLLLLWNTPPQPNYEIYQLLEKVYQLQAPSLAIYEDLKTYEQNLHNLAKVMIDCEGFQKLFYEQLIYEVTYSIDDYLSLLSTLSPYIALPAETRNNLFVDLEGILEKNCGKNIELSYLSAFHIFAKK